MEQGTSESKSDNKTRCESEERVLELQQTLGLEFGD